MSARHGFRLLTIFFVCVLAVVLGSGAWSAHRMIYASPANESLFLET
jgi:hypothetical protein